MALSCCNHIPSVSISRKAAGHKNLVYRISIGNVPRSQSTLRCHCRLQMNTGQLQLLLHKNRTCSNPVGMHFMLVDLSWDFYPSKPTVLFVYESTRVKMSDIAENNLRHNCLTVAIKTLNNQSITRSSVVNRTMVT